MFSVRFYETAAGNKVVREWLRSFDKEDRAVLGEGLKTVQIGFPMVCRSVGRSETVSGRFAAPCR